MGLWAVEALHSTATIVLRGSLRLVWASAYALSQYFPVLLWPLWLGRLFFLCRSSVLTLTLCNNICIYLQLFV